MTGRGPGRDAPGDRGGASGGDRRNASTGAQRDVSRVAGRGAQRNSLSAEAGRPASSLGGDVELEELPAQPVIPRGSAKLGRSGTLAVVAIIGLLAAGFGLLGGRPSPTPEPTLGAVSTASTAVPRPTFGNGPGPMVSPWMECATPPSEAPEVLLEVGGQTTPGSVELISGPNGVVPTPDATPEDPGLPGRVDVPQDVITELWIVGGTCAYAWSIELVDTGVLDSLPNPGLDPAYAAQNRFTLILGPYGGGDYELRADLHFPTFIARVTWPIRVLPFGRPAGILSGLGDDSVALAVEGCDIVMSLGNGWEDGLDCDDDLSQEPGEALDVRSGQALSFQIRDWQLSNGFVVCGRLSDLSFVAEPEPACELEVVPEDSTLTFLAPVESGRWTLAISACGNQFGSQVSNRICGTWYATIDVR